MFPGLLDRYLARKGYSAQLTDETANSGQPDNLFDPVPGDPGTHGRFDDRASNLSLQLWATEHRGAIVAGGLAAAAFMATVFFGGRPLARTSRFPVKPPSSTENY